MRIIVFFRVFFAILAAILSAAAGACGPLTYDQTRNETNSQVDVGSNDLPTPTGSVRGVDPNFRIVTPGGEIVSSRPIVAWTAAAGAVSYELEVGRNPDCLPALTKFSGLTLTQIRLNDLVAPGPFYLCLFADLADGTRLAAISNGTFRLDATGG